MADISFKTKVKNAHYADGTLAYSYVAVPKLERRHCDMHAFRCHPKFRGLANSDLFPNVLARIKRDIMSGRDVLRLDMLPDNVKIDTNGFLAEVTITV